MAWPLGMHLGVRRETEEAWINKFSFLAKPVRLRVPGVSCSPSPAVGGSVPKPHDAGRGGGVPLEPRPR